MYRGFKSRRVPFLLPMPLPDHVLESERWMQRDVETHPDLYAALAGEDEF